MVLFDIHLWSVYAANGTVEERRRVMARRRFFSLNQAASYLEISREKVLLLELDEEDFPEHFTDAEERVFWDANELETWAEEAGWFEDEDDEENS